MYAPRDAACSSRGNAISNDGAVPVTAYKYQPDDDDDTFVDHGSSAAQGAPEGSSDGNGNCGHGTSSYAQATAGAAAHGACVPRGSRPLGSAGGEPFTLDAYYANMAAARASAGGTCDRGSMGVTRQAQRSSSSPTMLGSTVPRGTSGGAGVSPSSGAAPAAAAAAAPGAVAAPLVVSGSPSAPRVSGGDRGRSSIRRDAAGNANGIFGKSQGAASSGAGASGGSSGAGGYAADRRALVARYPPASMVSELFMEKKKVRDMALSPDGHHLFAAIDADPVCELEVGVGKTGDPQLTPVRSYDSTEQVHCMSVVRVGGVNKTTFTSVDGSRANQKRTRKSKRGFTAANPDFSSDNDGDFDDGDDGNSGYGASATSGGRRNASRRDCEAGGDENAMYTLWCGLNRGTITIIDLQTCSSAGTILNAHKQTVNKIWYLENGRVWSAGRDKALAVWDPTTRKQIKRRNVAAIVSDLCYVSQLSQVWAVANDNYIRLFDAGGNNAAPPKQDRVKATDNTLQMKSEASLVSYYEDMNIVWVGLVRSTSLIDPISCKTLSKLRLVVSAVTFHEKTCIAMAHGPLVGTEDEVAVILDITSPLTPSLLYRGARVESVLPSIGLRLFTHLPFGVVAHTSNARAQDCSLGLFVYGEREMASKAAGTGPVNQQQPLTVLKQRTEVVGMRNVVKSHPAPKHPQHPMQTSQLQQLQLTYQPSQMTLQPTTGRQRQQLLSPQPPPSPQQQQPQQRQLQLSAFAARHSTSSVMQLTSPAVDSTPGGGAPYAAAPLSPSMRSPGAASAGRMEQASGRSIAVQPLSAVSPQLSAGTVASSTAEIQASFTQLDKKIDDMRVALSTQARTDKPQADFAKLHSEMAAWMLETDIDLPLLSSEDSSALDKAYHTPEGKTLAIATARLRRYAEMTANGSGAAVSNSASAAVGANAQQALISARATRLSTVATASNAPRLSQSDQPSTSPSPRLTLGHTPGSQLTSNLVAGLPPTPAPDVIASTVGAGGEEALTAMILAERLGHMRQMECLRRHNHRVEERAETLARGFNAVSAAVEALALEAERAAQTHACSLASGDLNRRAEAEALERCAQSLRRWVDAASTSAGGKNDSRYRATIITETSARVVRRSTQRVVEGVEQVGAAVRLLTTAVSRSCDPSPFGTMVGRRESSSCSRSVNSSNNSNASSSDIRSESGQPHTCDRRGSSAEPLAAAALLLASRTAGATNKRRGKEVARRGGGGLDKGTAAASTSEPGVMLDGLLEPTVTAAAATASAASTSVSLDDGAAGAATASPSLVAPPHSSSTDGSAVHADPASTEPRGTHKGTDRAEVAALLPLQGLGARGSAAAAASGTFTVISPSAFSSASPPQTIVVTSPRILLEVLKAGVSDTELFISSMQQEWSQKTTMYPLFAMGAYTDGGDGGGTLSLASEFIQCLAVWDLWFAQQMRTACMKELEIALTEVLLECRRDESDCVLTSEAGVGFMDTAPLLYDGGNGASSSGSGAAGNGGNSGVVLSHSAASLVNSTRGGLVTDSTLNTTSSTLSSALGTQSVDGSGSHYLIHGGDLFTQREELSHTLVRVSLQLEETVSDMRGSLSEMLSSIPSEVRRNPRARGFASMIHRWEQQQQQHLASLREETVDAPASVVSNSATPAMVTAVSDANAAAAAAVGAPLASSASSAIGASASAATPAAPIRLYADKLRGTLYWADVCINLIAVALDAIQRLLYPADGNTSIMGTTTTGTNGSNGATNALRIRVENFLFILSRLTEWTFMLRREERIGEGIAAVMKWLLQCGQTTDVNSSGSTAAASALMSSPLLPRAQSHREHSITKGREDDSRSTDATTAAVAAPVVDASQSYAQARGIYLLRSYFCIAVSRARQSQSPEQLINVLFSGDTIAAAAADALKAEVAAGAGNAEAGANSVAASAAADAASEARLAAEALARGDVDLNDIMMMCGGLGNVNSGAGGPSYPATPMPSPASLSPGSNGNGNNGGNTTAMAANTSTSRIGERVRELSETASALQHKAAVLRVFAQQLQIRMEWISANCAETSGGVAVPCVKAPPLPPSHPQGARAGLFAAVRVSQCRDVTGANVAVPFIDLTEFVGY